MGLKLTKSGGFVRTYCVIFALLTKSNIGVKGQKDLLSKLDKISNSAGAMPVWLLSHPKAKERINAIETLEKKWSK